MYTSGCSPAPTSPPHLLLTTSFSFSLSFGTNITCKTGRYQGQKVPSDLLSVVVSYGKNTTKEVQAAFQYSENPKVSEFAPDGSFLW